MRSHDHLARAQLQFLPRLRQFAVKTLWRLCQYMDKTEPGPGQDDFFRVAKAYAHSEVQTNMAPFCVRAFSGAAISENQWMYRR